MPDIVDRLRDADRATTALYDWIFQDSIREIVRLREVNAEFLAAIQGLLDALPSATTHPAIRAARAAIAKATQGE